MPRKMQNRDKRSQYPYILQTLSDINASRPRMRFWTPETCFVDANSRVLSLRGWGDGPKKLARGDEGIPLRPQMAMIVDALLIGIALRLDCLLS